MCISWKSALVCSSGGSTGMTDMPVFSFLLSFAYIPVATVISMIGFAYVLEGV